MCSVNPKAINSVAIFPSRRKYTSRMRALTTTVDIPDTSMSRDLLETLPGTHQNLPDVLPVCPNYRVLKETRKDGKTSSAVHIKQSFANNKCVSLPKDHCQNALNHLADRSVTQFQDKDTGKKLAKRTDKGDDTSTSKCSNTEVKDDEGSIERKSTKTEKCQTLIRSHAENDTEQNRKEPIWNNKGRKESCRSFDGFINQAQSSRRPVKESGSTVETLKKTATQLDTCTSLKENFFPKKTSTPKRNSAPSEKTHGECGTEKYFRKAVTAEEFLQCLKKHQEHTKRLLEVIKSNDHLMKDVAHSSAEIRKVTSALNSLCNFDDSIHLAKNFPSNQASNVSVHNHSGTYLKSNGSIKKKQDIIIAVKPKEQILNETSKSKSRKQVCSFSCALNGTCALGQRHNTQECRNCSASHRITKGNVGYGGKIRPLSDETERSVLNATQTMPKILPGSVRGNVEFPQSSEVPNVQNQIQKDKGNSTSSEMTNRSSMSSNVQTTKNQLALSTVSAETKGNNEICKYNGSYSSQGTTLDDIAFRCNKRNKLITQNDSESNVKNCDEQFQSSELTESSEIVQKLSRGLICDSFVGYSAGRETGTTPCIKQSGKSSGSASADKIPNCKRSTKQTSDVIDETNSSNCELPSKQIRPIDPKLNKDQLTGFITKQDQNRSNNLLDMHKRRGLPFDYKYGSLNDTRSSKICDEEIHVRRNTQNNFMTSSDCSLSERPSHSSPSPELQDDGKKRKKSSKYVKEAYFKKTNGNGGYISLEEKKSDGEMFNQQPPKEIFKAKSLSERRNLDLLNDTQTERSVKVVLPNRDRWLQIGGENVSPRKELCKSHGSKHDEKDNDKSAKSQLEKKGEKTETDKNQKRSAYRPEYLEAVNKHKAILRRKMGLGKELHTVSNVGGVLVNSTMGKTLDDDENDQEESSTSLIGENDKTNLKSSQSKCSHASEKQQSAFLSPKISTQNDRRARRELNDSQGYGLKEGKPNEDGCGQCFIAGLKCEHNVERHDKFYDNLTCPPLLSYRSSQKEKMKISSRIWKTPKKFSRYATLNPCSHIRHQNCKHRKKKVYVRKACKNPPQSGGFSLKKGRDNKLLQSKTTIHCFDECKITLNNENGPRSANAVASKDGGGTKKRQTMSSTSARIWDELLKGTMLSRSKETHKDAACNVSIERTSYELKRLLHHTHFGIQGFEGAEEMASKCWKSALNEVSQITDKPKRSTTKDRDGSNIFLGNSQSQKQEQIFGDTSAIESLSLKLSSNGKLEDGNKPFTLQGQTEKYHPSNCAPLHERDSKSSESSQVITDETGNKMSLYPDDPKKHQQVEAFALNGLKENVTKAYPIGEATKANETAHRVENKNLSVARMSQEKNQSSTLARDNGIDKDSGNTGKSERKGSLSLQIENTAESFINEDQPSMYSSSPQSPQDIFDFSWHSGDFSKNDDGEKVYYQNNIYHVEVETTPLKNGDNYNLQNSNGSLEKRNSTSKSENVTVPGAVVEEDVTRNGTAGRECSETGEMGANNTFGVNRDCKEIMPNFTSTEATNIGNDAVTLDDDTMQGTRCRVTTEDGEALWIQVDDLNYF
ncbi:hypothetical protein HOLleu_00344 [Holothuria leucospilota]|uniref:Uncharacterized protein n=1 Tax=Holothuria leucospilota TaxID=206669 RepID=A0A9Q1CNH6_HOLLE|nr:hypothetical protein HOLleu_00344 [Holothuria leucospilota]